MDPNDNQEITEGRPSTVHILSIMCCKSIFWKFCTNTGSCFLVGWAANPRMCTGEANGSSTVPHEV